MILRTIILSFVFTLASCNNSGNNNSESDKSILVGKSEKVNLEDVQAMNSQLNQSPQYEFNIEDLNELLSQNIIDQAEYDQYLVLISNN